MATPAPALLRALADDLRTTASAIDLDVDPLADRGGPSTWQGPAADAYRRAASGMEDLGRAAADGTRAFAADLDRLADVIEAEQAAVARDRAAAAAERRAGVEEAGHG